MSAYVYILQSNKGTYYVGSTTDIERRIRQHKRGHTPTTKRLGEMTLVFSQEFDSLDNARYIERKIKSWKRSDYIEKIIKDGYIKTTGCGADG